MCAFALAFIHVDAAAQDQVPTHKHLMKEDSAALNALVMYPDTIRLHIFEACEYPSAIVSIASLQKSSSDEFVALIGTYSKSEQENFWDLSRYPGLISRLVQEGKESVDHITIILKDYPAEIHETAMKYGMGYFPILQKMDEIQVKTDTQFDQILTDYPPETQQALRVLIQYPEIINLLNDHLGLTVRVGDRYRRNPQGVIHRADSLYLAQTRQNAEDAEEWKESIQQNPDEAADLKSAADAYATENGYSQEDVAAAPDPEYVNNYTCYPYSYWYGYPTWYPYSYWYPYPYWFDCGFYRDRDGEIVIIGPPSRYFTDWYFYSPEHLHRYPHLGDGYVDHYYGRPRPGANSGIVHAWVHDHKRYLPNDFVTNRDRRPEIIRQVGILDVDVRKQNGGRPITPEIQDKYIRENSSKFPALNSEPRKRTEVEVREPILPSIIERPTKQPPIRISMPIQQVQMDQRQPSARPGDQRISVPEPSKPQPIRTVNPPTTEPVFKPRPATSSPGYNFNTIHNAQEYQRNVWEQTQPTVRPQPQPAPRVQPQPVQRPQVSQPQPRQQMQQPARPAPSSGGRTRDK